MWGQFWRLLRSCNKISLNTPQWPQGWLSPMSCGKLTHSDHEGAQLLWCYYSWENKKTICRNFIGAINKFSVELFSRECWGHTRPSVPRWNVQHGKLHTGVGFLCSKRDMNGGRGRKGKRIWSFYGSRNCYMLWWKLYEWMYNVF